MATLWQWRLILVVPLVAATNANRDTLADIFANNGSGESVANERLMFQCAAKLALATSPSVQAGWGLSFPVKLSMRDGLTTAITTINAGLSAANKIQWYLLKNDVNAGELISSSRNTAYVNTRIGQVFTDDDIGTDLGIVRMVETLP